MRFNTLYFCSTVQLVFFLMLLITQDTERRLENCPEPNYEAERTLKFFLIKKDNPPYNTIKKRNGLEDIPAVQLRAVKDTQTCSRITALLNEKSHWGEAENEYSIHFYRTDDYYFAIYKRRKFALGLTPLAIFNMDLEFVDFVGL